MVLAFCGCSLLPLSYHFYLLPENKEVTDIPTEYEFQQVEGPIQPIPKISSIDDDWRLLGRALFNSTLLSKDNSISCASCHSVNAGGDDGFAVSTGVNSQKGERNSPTVLNAVFNFRQFWDGREPSLAAQINGPIHNPVEMATNWPDVVGKLQKDPYFSKAFRDISVKGVTEQNIVKAIVTYEESLVTPNSPIDRYLLGDKAALTPQQVRGLDKFITYGCATCHQGRNIGGNFFQKLGRIDEIPQKLTKDLGRFKSSKDPADRYVFKVPSLRNVAQTAPYFHNGSVESLSEAVDIMAKTQLGLSLNERDNQDIVALLKAFSAPTMETVADE